MPARNVPFTENGYYHIYNRGSEKRTIFQSHRDYSKFLKRVKENAVKFSVDILCYCLMPNHFHFLLMQKQAQGIVGFMNSLQLGHAKYFNTKYSRVGPLYQGRFKAKIIEEDEYLLYVSAYIHRNPIAGLLDSGNRSNSRNLNRLVTFVRDYPYSSYREYLYPQENILAKTEAISEFFSSTNPQLTYSSFVENFTLDIEMLIPHLADT